MPFIVPVQQELKMVEIYKFNFTTCCLGCILNEVVTVTLNVVVDKAAKQALICLLIITAKQSLQPKVEFHVPWC